MNFNCMQKTIHGHEVKPEQCIGNCEVSPTSSSDRIWERPRIQEYDADGDAGFPHGYKLHHSGCTGDAHANAWGSHGDRKINVYTACYCGS